MANKEKSEKKAFSIDEALSILDSINEDASMLDKSAMSLVNSFIDSGSYVLNGIMSGGLRRGIPSGRIVGYIGPSGCGKTLMMLKAVAAAQREQGRIAVIFDSENAVDMQTAINLGCDPTKIKHCPVETVESCRNQIVKFLNGVNTNPELKGKFIIIIDSIANLSSEKEQEDAVKNKSASDMGLRAKALKSLFRTITYKTAKADCPILFSNHIYDDPAAMFESIKKNQSGGRGPEYMASINVQLNARPEKTDEEALPIAREGSTGGSGKKAITGIDMDALTVKNRFLPPFLECHLNLNFRTGLKRYYGLIPMAKDMGVLEGSNSYTFVKGPYAGEKIGQEKKFADDVTVWEKIVDSLDEAIQKQFKFSCETENESIAADSVELDEETADIGN